MTEITSDELGTQMHSRAIALCGRLPLHKWKKFLSSVVESMGMTPADKAAVWRYPTAEGKGGTGWTLCLPLTESFVVLDVWEKHDGAYLLIASCKRFAISRVTETALHFGLDVDDCSAPVTMRLK